MVTTRVTLVTLSSNILHREDDGGEPEHVDIPERHQLDDNDVAEADEAAADGEGRTPGPLLLHDDAGRTRLKT